MNWGHAFWLLAALVTIACLWEAISGFSPAVCGAAVVSFFAGRLIALRE